MPALIGSLMTAPSWSFTISHPYHADAPNGNARLYASASDVGVTWTPPA